MLPGFNITTRCFYDGFSWGSRLRNVTTIRIIVCWISGLGDFLLEPMQI
jgi:hypothetical protein